jgi:tRNA threonylcarbamoyladenosine biosynthesis protein TsaB
VSAATNEVNLFAVCVGPGGFTGLRVGIAAVKGFAMASAKPVVGVTSLEAAAFEAGRASLVCAMVNAYKAEVYSQLFSFDDAGVPVAESEPRVSTMVEAVERVEQIDDVIFAGDGARSASGIIERVAGQRFAGDAKGEHAWRIKNPGEAMAVSIARLGFKK